MTANLKSPFSLVLAVLIATGCSGRPDITAPLPPLPLNDTGASFCRDVSGLTANCSGAPAQDGNTGRDSVNPSKQGNGPLAFDWTKLDRAGNALTNQTLDWQTEGTEQAGSQWSCVQDHHTGLLWEVKSDHATAVNHAALRYSWYNADGRTNGENPGSENTDDCNGVACNTAAYINHLNSLNWCGHNDWRLPSTNELLSLVVTDNLDLVADTGYFPNAINDQYWSYQTYAPIRERAWYLYFSDGSFGFTLKSQPNYVRLVSGDLAITQGGE